MTSGIESKQSFISTVATILDEYVEAYGTVDPPKPVEYIDFPWAFDEHETYALVNYLLECGFLTSLKDELEHYAGHSWDGF